MNRSAIRAVLLSALAYVLLPTTPSFAQEDLATKQAKQHFQKGMQYFQAGDFPNAVTELKEAYKIKRLPALLFNIGQTYRKMDDTDTAIFYFEKFLKESPPNAPNRGEAEKILAELKAKKAAGGGRGQVVVPPPLEGPGEVQPQTQQPPPQPPPRRRRQVDKFEHTTVDEVPPTTPLDIRIMLPDQEGLRATVYYRSAGQEEYTPVAMHQRYDEWVGRIPGESIAGRSFQYYIEARDAQGRVIGKSGSPAEPNIVSITEGAKPQFYADLTEGPTGGEVGTEVQPPRKLAKRKKRRAAEEEEEEYEGPRTLHNFRTLKWVSTGVAAGALALGATFEILASSKAGDVESSACRLPCGSPNAFFGSDLQDSQSSGQTFSTMGTILLITGAAATGAAITFWVLDDSAEMRENREQQRRVGPRPLAVAPLLGPTARGDLAWGVASAWSF
ncbi:MAG TPA: tetratricopeptide repeat protein [Polyangia bacterium]|nr:tetratricopeptide repeat protein [Polyangia bacterium]